MDSSDRHDFITDEFNKLRISIDKSIDNTEKRIYDQFSVEDDSRPELTCPTIRLTERAKRFQHVKDFYEQWITPCIDVQEKYHICGIAIMAQVALETGWGRKVTYGYPAHKVNSEWKPINNNRVNSYNYFNIKGKGPAGAVYLSAPEYIDGKWVMVGDVFRRYHNRTESITDYVRLMSTKERYAEAWAHRHDHKRYVRLMHKAGYATAPNYADQLIKIMERYLGA